MLILLIFILSCYYFHAMLIAHSTVIFIALLLLPFPCFLSNFAHSAISLLFLILLCFFCHIYYCHASSAISTTALLPLPFLLLPRFFCYFYYCHASPAISTTSILLLPFQLLPCFILLLHFYYCHFYYCHASYAFPCFASINMLFLPFPSPFCYFYPFRLLFPGSPSSISCYFNNFHFLSFLSILCLPFPCSTYYQQWHALSTFSIFYLPFPGSTNNFMLFVPFPLYYQLSISRRHPDCVLCSTYHINQTYKFDSRA